MQHIGMQSTRRRIPTQAPELSSELHTSQHAVAREQAEHVRGYDVGGLSAGFHPILCRIGGTAMTIMGPMRPMTME